MIMTDTTMTGTTMTDITTMEITTMDTTMMDIIIADIMIMIAVKVVVVVVLVTMVDMLRVIEAILKVEHINIQISTKTVNTNGQHTHQHGITNGVIVDNQKKLKVQAKVILEEIKMINIDLY